MYNKTLITSFVLALSVVSSAQIFAANSCRIESGPIPELALYVRSVETRLTQISAESRQAGKCGITPAGASSSVERTIDTIDRALLEVPLSTNILLDFRYNVETAINGESRAAVLEQGRLFTMISDRISSTIATMSNRCVLDGSIRSSLSSLLSENQTLENIYKQAVLGMPVESTSLSSENAKLIQAINASYIPSATEGCKPPNNQSVGDGIDTIIAKTQQLIELAGAKNQNVWTDWEKALLLFQGGGNSAGGIAQYNTTQRQLLQTELARQGYSSRVAQRMLEHFDCVKIATRGDNSLPTLIQAKGECATKDKSLIETFVLLPVIRLVNRAPTTDARSYAVNNLTREQKLKNAIATMAGNLQVYRNSDMDIKASLMTNLIDIHIGLLSTSNDVEKRLPNMLANCMKAQPSISCPRP